MKHFYFKFQRENKGIDLWLKKHINKKPIEGEQIDLSIYYGTWSCQDFKNEEWEKKYEAERNKTIDSVSKKQIKLFFSLPKGAYFWVYYNQYVLCFQSVDLSVDNGTEILYNIDGSIDSVAKSRKAKLLKSYEKKDLPEFFSNLNSNQAYNRRTITELKPAEEKFANFLVSDKTTKIKINEKNYIDFLSPTEFETLIYEIIMRSHTNNFCSSFRGSTLKDFDLRVKIVDGSLGLPKMKENYWIQIKKKKVPEKEFPIKSEIVLIHTGDSDKNRDVFGLDWITDQISRNQEIKAWLKEMTFNYHFFVFDWK